MNLVYGVKSYDVFRYLDHWWSDAVQLQQLSSWHISCLCFVESPCHNDFGEYSSLCQWVFLYHCQYLYRLTIFSFYSPFWLTSIAPVLPSWLIEQLCSDFRSVILSTFLIFPNVTLITLFGHGFIVNTFAVRNQCHDTIQWRTTSFLPRSISANFCIYYVTTWSLMIIIRDLIDFTCCIVIDSWEVST